MVLNSKETTNISEIFLAALVLFSCLMTVIWLFSFVVLVFASPTLKKTCGSSADKCFNMLSSYLLIFSICVSVLQVSLSSVTRVDSTQHLRSLASFSSIKFILV